MNTNNRAAMRKRKRRIRIYPAFILLALAVVGAIFIAFIKLNTINAQIEAGSGHAQETAAPLVVQKSAPPEVTPKPSPYVTPEPTATPYTPDEAEVEMLARVIWGEARGIPSDMEKAAVVWCVLNRVDADAWPDTVEEVVTQPYQFTGYLSDYPATEEHKAIAADVLTRWEQEKREGGDVGRVLPAEYVFFSGDGKHNYFRTEYRGGAVWDWTAENPYDS